MKKFLRIEEAADVLSVSPKTIRKWVQDRKIESVKVGRAVRISMTEIDKITERGRREAVSL